MMLGAIDGTPWSYDIPAEVFRARFAAPRRARGEGDDDGDGEVGRCAVGR